MCCDGRKVICVWKHNYAGITGKAAQLVHDCIYEHEAVHLPETINCTIGQRCTTELKRGGVIWWDTYGSECRAYKREVRCLQRARNKCGDDTFCRSNIRIFLEQAADQRDAYCKWVFFS